MNLSKTLCSFASSIKSSGKLAESIVESNGPSLTNCNRRKSMHPVTNINSTGSKISAPRSIENNMMLRSMNEKETYPEILLSFRGHEHAPGPEGFQARGGMFEKPMDSEIASHSKEGGGQFISTTTNLEVAKKFATDNNSRSGYVSMILNEKKKMHSTNQAFRNLAEQTAGNYHDHNTPEWKESVERNSHHRHEGEMEWVTTNVPPERIFTRPVNERGAYMDAPSGLCSTTPLEDEQTPTPGE